jgi:hypothetical protein
MALLYQKGFSKSAPVNATHVNCGRVSDPLLAEVKYSSKASQGASAHPAPLIPIYGTRHREFIPSRSLLLQQGLLEIERRK